MRIFKIISFLPWMLLATPFWPAQAEPVTVVAHRGGQFGETENSLGALRAAAARGIEIVELDVRTTRDGQLVILHDEAVDRTTNGSGMLSRLTLEELRRFRLDGSGAPVPTLAEALAAAESGSPTLLLDIKPGTSVREVLKKVRQDGAEKRVILGLRRSIDVANAHSDASAIPILAFMPKAGDAAEFAYAGAKFIRIWSDWAQADPALVERTRALGVQPWIMVGHHLPSKASDWRQLHARMMALRPDGLITDRPDLITPAP